MSLPGACDQHPHRDGLEVGLYNAFVPLVPLTRQNGATRLVPRTHARQEEHTCSPVAPLLQPGEMLLFDYRCVHNGLANHSAERRAIAYVNYSAPGVRDAHNFPSDVSLRDYCRASEFERARTGFSSGLPAA